MGQTIAIVGAGIAGSWIGYRLAAAGHEVTLFDAGRGLHQSTACSRAAGGLLCPFTEMDYADPSLWPLGIRSLALWEDLQREGIPFYFRRQGTLVVCPESEKAQWDHLQRRLVEALGNEPAAYRRMDAPALAQLEPQLSPRYASVHWFENEGQVDPLGAWQALREGLAQNGAHLHEKTEVTEVAPYRVSTELRTHEYDRVFDCRGMGAAADLPSLRGVRGERLTLHAPGIGLQRPIRLLHSQYPIYLAPLPGDRYIVGATCIESDARTPLTVRSALELLSGLYLLESQFAEAAIIDSQVNVRPAYPDNLPEISWSAGLTRVNGLYRHGFLLSPALAEMIEAKVGDRAEASPFLKENVDGDCRQWGTVGASESL